MREIIALNTHPVATGAYAVTADTPGNPAGHTMFVLVNAEGAEVGRIGGADFGALYAAEVLAR